MWILLQGFHGNPKLTPIKNPLEEGAHTNINSTFLIVSGEGVQ